MLRRLVDGRNRVAVVRELIDYSRKKSHPWTEQKDGLRFSWLFPSTLETPAGLKGDLEVPILVIQSEDAVATITRLNILRRHLTPAQRAIMVNKIYAAEGKRKMTKADAGAIVAEITNGKPATAKWRLPEIPAITVSERAAQADVPVRTMERIDRIEREMPELIEPIENVSMPVATAEKIVKTTKTKKPKPTARPATEAVEDLFDSLHVTISRILTLAEKDKSIERKLQEALETYVN